MWLFLYLHGLSSCIICMLPLLWSHAKESAMPSSILQLHIACVHQHTHLHISKQAAAAVGLASGGLLDSTIGQCCKPFAATCRTSTVHIGVQGCAASLVVTSTVKQRLIEKQAFVSPSYSYALLQPPHQAQCKLANFQHCLDGMQDSGVASFLVKGLQQRLHTIMKQGPKCEVVAEDMPTMPAWIPVLLSDLVYT